MTESVDFFYQKEFLGSLALVHKCGNIIKDAFFKPKVISVKTEPTDLVTKTDKEVEEVLRSGLSLLLPNAPFVGEETSGKGVVLGDDATWVEACKSKSDGNLRQEKMREFQESFTGKFYGKVLRESFTGKFYRKFYGKVLRKSFTESFTGKFYGEMGSKVWIETWKDC